jgi:uncharacterized membrane protein YgcG
MTIPRILVLALAVFFECCAPQEVMSDRLPRLSGMVSDFRSSLKVGYVKDLEVRLERFNQRTGYAIVVVVIPSGEDERISDLKKFTRRSWQRLKDDAEAPYLRHGVMAGNPHRGHQHKTAISILSRN